MKHKGLLRLMACLLAVLLPLSAMAETTLGSFCTQAKQDGKELVATVSFAPGATLLAMLPQKDASSSTSVSVAQMVQDLCSAMSFRFNKLPGGLGGFALVLNNTDVAAAQLRVQKDGLYVQSETLGDKPLYFSWEDIRSGVIQLMKQNGVNDAQLEQLSGAFSSGMEQCLAAASAATSGTVQAPATVDEALAQITAVMGGDSGYADWIRDLLSRAVVTEGEFGSADSDKADHQKTITVKAEDLCKLFDIAYFQNMILTSVKSGDSSMTDDEAKTKADTTIQQIKDALTKAGVTIVANKLYKAENDLVGLDVTMDMNVPQTVTTTTPSDMTAPTEAADATAEPADAAAQPDVNVTTTEEMHAIHGAFQVWKKTLDDGKQYTFQATGAEDDATAFTVKGNLTSNSAGKNGTMTIAQGEDQLLAELNLVSAPGEEKRSSKLNVTIYGNAEPNMALQFALDEQFSADAVTAKFSVSMGKTVDALEASADSLLASMNIDLKAQPDSGFFADLSKATPESSVEVLKLSPTDLNTFTSALQSTAMKTFYNILGNLPSSVVEGIFGANGATKVQ